MINPSIHIYKPSVLLYQTARRACAFRKEATLPQLYIVAYKKGNSRDCRNYIGCGEEQVRFN